MMYIFPFPLSEIFCFDPYDSYRMEITRRYDSQQLYNLRTLNFFLYGTFMNLHKASEKLSLL